MSSLLSLWLVSLLVSVAASAVAEEPFEILETHSAGRTVSADLADLDGDGRTDLLLVVFSGVPPEDERRVRAYLQREDGSLPEEPDVDRPLPAHSAAYDVADVLPTPGEELLLLRPHGVTLMSLGRPGIEPVSLDVPDAPTLGAAGDERGLDRLRIACDEFGDEPWLMVPQLGETVFLDAQGGIRARLRVGSRANYFVPPRTAPLVVDSDIQLFYDAPRLSLGDVNGDGLTDVVGSGRHELRVFLRRDDGSFSSSPDRILPLRLVSEYDHVRGQGTVRAEARDIDADGKLDLIVAHSAGGLTKARSETRIYFNRDAGWDLDAPDRRLVTNRGWSADQLIDLDGDGRLELLQVIVPLGVLELVEALVTRAVDAEVAVYRVENSGFGEQPWFSRKLGISFSLETSRAMGFLPTAVFDVNGDGFRDLLRSGKGDRIEVYLGREEEAFRKRDARQEFPSAGRLRAGDFNGDGLTDLLLFDARNPELGVRIAVNRGILPGTLPRVAAPAR